MFVAFSKFRLLTKVNVLNITCYSRISVRLLFAVTDERLLVAMSEKGNSKPGPAEKKREICRDDMRTIMVRNLHPNITEELLYELFLQAGPLESVRIPKDKDGKRRNFGFIAFEHEVSVPYALALFEGTELFERRLDMNSRNKSRIDIDEMMIHGRKEWGYEATNGTPRKGPNPWPASPYIPRYPAHTFSQYNVDAARRYTEGDRRGSRENSPHSRQMRSPRGLWTASKSSSLSSPRNDEAKSHRDNQHAQLSQQHGRPNGASKRSSTTFWHHSSFSEKRGGGGGKSTPSPRKYGFDKSHHAKRSSFEEGSPRTSQQQGGWEKISTPPSPQLSRNSHYSARYGMSPYPKQGDVRRTTSTHGQRQLAPSKKPFVYHQLGTDLGALSPKHPLRLGPPNPCPPFPSCAPYKGERTIVILKRQDSFASVDGRKSEVMKTRCVPKLMPQGQPQYSRLVVMAGRHN